MTSVTALDDRLVEEMLALDLMTLRRHTEAAGDVLDRDAHRLAISASLSSSELLLVRRGSLLVACARLQPEDDDRWFVSGFGTHPLHRDGGTIRALLLQLIRLVERKSIAALRSNVYKTNRSSMAFHERLGFRVTRENARGVQFDATIADLRGNASLRRLSTRRGTTRA